MEDRSERHGFQSLVGVTISLYWFVCECRLSTVDLLTSKSGILDRYAIGCAFEW